MGCHTWFYTKIDVPIEDVRKSVIKQLNKGIYNCDEILQMEGEEKDEILDCYPEWTPEYMNNQKDVYMRQIRMVEKNLCEVATLNRYNHFGKPSNYRDDDGYYVTRYIEGDGIYINIDRYDDVFRKYGYPEVELRSLSETIDYVFDPKNDCIFHKPITQIVYQLKEFWEKYPNSFIRFG